MKDINKSVSLLCPICGNDQFESLNPKYSHFIDVPEDIRFRCSDCETVFTKGELLQENSELISIAIDEVKEEAVHELKKDIKAVMKKWRF